MRPLTRWTALLLALAAIVTAGCGSGDDKTTSSSASHSNASAGGPGDAGCPGGQVRFGIEPYEDPAKLTPAYTVLAQALQRRLGCPVKLQIARDEGLAVAVVLHQPDLARRHADRVVGLLGGIVAWDRAVAEVTTAEVDALYAEERTP
jgi:ABC-type phosphate/phosphonate transport system substrate-binding protein